MTKLIGTNPNQVPSNADLGSAAFMDKREFLLSRGSSLSAIDALINNTTASGVHIYDTSKDSDGGAWRKRTQHTSWYNEELNTSIRGSRREFPSVAVIVGTVTPQQITIYDADDPTLPMWRVLRAGNGTAHSSFIWDGDQMAFDAANGWIICCNHYVANTLYSGNGLYVYDMIGDQIRCSVNSYTGNVSSGTFAPFTRGVYNVDTADFTRPFNLGNYSVTDVAVTVKANAPIDESTGLPRPTIAVTHLAGTTVVNNDMSTSGVSTNYNNSWNSYKGGGLAWHNDSLWIYKYDDFYRIWNWEAISSTNTVTSAYESTASGGIYPYIGAGSRFGYNKPVDIAATKYDGLAFAFAGSSYDVANGLTRLTDEADSNNNMVNYITTTYNTGWLPCSTKVAALSDTEVGSRTYSNLVTNGDFSSGTGSWSGASATLSVGSGQLTVTGTASVPQNQNAFQNGIPIIQGRKYILRAEIVSTNSVGAVGFNLGGAVFDTWNGYKYYGGSFPKQVYETILATTPSLNLGLHAGINVGATSTFDNVSLTLAEDDRSVEKKGFEVFGTIKKRPVMAGAELVSYSGFSGSNQIIQQYNQGGANALDFGTGDFCYMLWAKHPADGTSTAYYLFDRADTDGTNRIGAYWIPVTNRIDMYSPGGTVSVTNVEPTLEEWTHVAFVRRSSTSYIYVNGRQLGSNSNTEDLTSSDGSALLRIGARFNGAEPWTLGELALFRAMDDAPTVEQIKKIYNDEKYLFQENAKATLYGSDNNVDAVAYDESTNLLHAGTSSGRSVFQGLRRIDNTTRGIGQNMSAANGLVVEE